MDGHSAGAGELGLLREEIDRVDAALVGLLGQRFALTERVGRYKAEQAIVATDPARERNQFVRLRAQALAVGLDPEVVDLVFSAIIDHVVRRHRVIATHGD
jgi:chorismate mutase